jgi:hypothetical protein
MRISRTLCVCIGTSFLLSVQAQIRSGLDNIEEPATHLVERALRRGRTRNSNRRSARRPVVEPFKPEIQAYAPFVCGANFIDAMERCSTRTIPKCEYKDDSIKPMKKPCWAQCDGSYSASYCNEAGEGGEVLSCQAFVKGCGGFL